MSYRRLAFCLIIVVASSACITVAKGERLSTLATIENIGNSEAQRHNDVSFVATVTYFRSYQRVLFVQDGDAAIYVSANTALNLLPGDRVLVRGELRPSFRPFVESNDIKLLGHGALPEPVHATVEQMISAKTDCRLVTVRATVRSADLVKDPNFLKFVTYLRLLIDGENVQATLDNNDEGPLQGLLDAEVEITGVESGDFDNKMQQTGVLFHIQSLKDVKVLKRATVDPWSIAVAPMDRIIVGRRMRDMSMRMRVHGTVTYYQPGQSMVLQDGQRSLRATTQGSPDVQIGDIADAIGFPDVQNGFLTLTQSEVRDDMVKAPVAPVLYKWNDLSVGGNDGLSHIFDLVSIEGEVVTEVRQATQDEYVLNADGHLFSAIFRHPGSVSRVPLEPMRLIPVGSRIRVTGICMLADANPFNGEVPFNILMRSFDDIAVLNKPSWLSVTHLLYLVAVLLIAILLVGARAWLIEYKTRRRTTALAHIEQRRGLILENMNASKPLGEILEQIAALVTFKLRGLPCWCEIAGGSTFGSRPDDTHNPAWKVIEHAIPSNSRAPLGTLYVAILGHSPTASEAAAALAQAAGLASLAIETSQLHSDLVHRSEFDLLTDVRNRFSLEQSLDAMIAQARQCSGQFGLIYIDLNDFKQVNDQYGHLAGDIYLQEATRRMKSQIRPGDTLSRLGGDEFAVLVSDVRGPAVVEEVAQRLNRCFDEPFACEGVILHGSASVGIAMYPADGTTRDSLLSASDAAMYVVKQTQKTDSKAIYSHRAY